MPLLFNVRHLKRDNLILRGELSAIELEINGLDELIQVHSPLSYELEIEQYQGSILVHGRLQLTLRCECVRCLTPFDQRIELNDWSCLLPLDGEDKVLISNDCVDLTPYLREDILLAFPQHPLCEVECNGLQSLQTMRSEQSSGTRQSGESKSAWTVLENLKL